MFRKIGSGILLIIVMCIVIDSPVAIGKETPSRPTLPLPEPTPEQLAESGWPDGRAMGNSVRAWHYNPSLVQPMRELSNAVEDCDFSRKTIFMLIVVVASRNECRY